ncbi:PLD nuclease N-terminal domain-containing protein [Rhodococcoides fascians]|uniref:PLD nuclease N-terminal domain-containing protein n=1 Tax=Rhodococcoides fascians TaxID=1828 RepID=UPI00056062D9|nr:PLD nuclease N-terminal domain-containing protein [Rhodococcus fascians]
MPYFGVLVLLLWVFALIDVVTADEGGVRYLPKMVWLLLVIFVPLAGSLVWLVAGRPVGGGIWGGSGTDVGVRGRGQGVSAFPEYETRPGRQLAQNPEADEEFLRQCRARAEEQRRIERERRRRDTH